MRNLLSIVFFLLFITEGFSQTYCTPPTTQCEWESVLRRFNSFGGVKDIQFSSASCTSGGFSYETNDTIVVKRGSDVSFMAGGTGVMPFSIFSWIDFDQNGSFQEPGEMVYDHLDETPISSNNIHPYTVNIPANAPLGITRMRVLLHQNLNPNYLNSSPGSCVYFHGQKGMGQTRDFVIKIVDTTNCTQNPNTANIRVVEHYKCALEPVVLYSRTGLSPDATYQWLSATTSGGPFTPDSGATNPVHLVTPAVDTYFRLQINCGSMNFTSPVFHVVVRTQPLNGTYTINRLIGEGNRTFNSIRKFAQALECNGVSGPVTANIANNSGTYRGDVHFRNIQNPDSFPIVINGNNQIMRPFRGINLEIVLGNFGLTSNNLTISNSHYLTFNDLTIEVPSINNTETAIIQNGSSHIAFNGVDFINENTHRYVVLLRNCSHITLENCSLVGGRSGVFENIMHFINQIEIRQSTFVDQNRQNINLADVSNALIENNTFTRTSAPVTDDFTSVHLVGNKITVNRNEFFELAPINFNDSLTIIQVKSEGNDSLNITNNLIHNNHSRGNQIVFALETNSTSSPILTLGHNTVYFNRTTGDKSLKWWRGVAFLGPQYASATIVNNLWYINRETPNTQFYYGFVSSTAPITFDYNSYFHPTFNAGTMFFSDVNGVKYNQFSDWQQNAPVRDDNAFWVDPDFVQAGVDFTPKLPILASSGISIGLTDDVFGMPRDANTPSVGAIEFSPPVGTDPMLEGIDLDSIICSGDYSITLLANNYGGTAADSILIEMVKNGVTTTHMVRTTLEPGISTPIVVDVVTLTPTDMLNLEFTILESYPGPDLDTSNNSFAINGVRTQMSGVYSVDRFQPSSGTNFVSHMDAVHALNTYGICGSVTIETAPFTGPYNEFLHLKRVEGSSAFQTITFDGSNVRINPTPDFKNNTALWQVERGEFVTIKNFEFHVTGTAQELENCDIILVSNRSESIRILNNSFSLPNVPTTSHIRVVGDKFIENFLPLKDTLIIDGNSLDGGEWGIVVLGFPTNRSSQLEIGNNHLINSRKNIYIKHFNELYFQKNSVTIKEQTGIFLEGVHNSKLEQNAIYFNDIGESNISNIVAGIKTEAAGGSLDLSNNIISLIADNMSSGDWIYGLQLNLTPNATVNLLHNTIYLRSIQQTDIRLPKNAMSVLANACQSFTAKNNVFYAHAPTGHTIFYGIDNGAASSSIDNNVYYSLNEDKHDVVMLENNTQLITSFSGWQSAFGEANGVYSTPLFFDINAQDYYPQSERIAQIAATLSPPISIDYFDSIRKNPADPGAIEFDPLPCPGLLSQTASFKDSILMFRWEGTTKEVDLIYGPAGFDTASAGTTVLNLTDEEHELSNWQAGECYDYFIRQHCHTGGTSGWEGPVNICVPHEIDLGVIISSPNPICHPAFGDLTITIDVYNNGLNPVEDFTIKYTTQGIAFIDDSLVVTNSIAPGDTVSFFIAVTGNNIEEGGRLIFNVDLRVPNDGKRSNDFMGQSYYIIPYRPFPKHIAVCPNNTDPVTLFAKRFPGVGHAWFDIDTNAYRLYLHEGDTFITNAVPGDTFYLGYFNYPPNHKVISGFPFDDYQVLNPNSAASSSEYNPDVQKDEFTSACYYPVTYNHDPYLLLSNCETRVSVQTLNGAAPKDALFRVNADNQWSKMNLFVETKENQITMNRSSLFEFFPPTFNSTGEVDLALHLGRFSDGLGCGTNQVSVNANAWDAILEYQYIACSHILTPIIIEETPLPEAGFDFAENAMRGFFTSTADNIDSSYFEVITLGLGGKPGKRVEFDFPALGSYLVCQYVYNACGADTICEWIDIKNVQFNIDEEELVDMLTLFPNPSNGNLTIRADGAAFAETDIHIVDALGNSMQRLQWNAPIDGRREKSLALDHLAAGAYLIEMRQGNRRVVKRWIKL